MKNYLFISIVAFTMSSISWGATAYYTGNNIRVNTVTMKLVWKCQYNVMGHTFWRVFRNSCPMSIQVE